MEKENRTFCPLDRKNAGDTILKGSIGDGAEDSERLPGTNSMNSF
ncbi:MAG: hypothetical protein ACLUOI_00595 [Eisenbergiella sp.]